MILNNNNRFYCPNECKNRKVISVDHELIESVLKLCF